jgi:multidrug efflux system membrane fusion protein
MQSIMEKLPKLPDKKKLVAGAAVVVLAAAGWQLYSSITHKPQEANYIPIVRTMTIGESIVDSSAVYPGEVRGRYESQLAFQTAGRIASRLVNVGDQVHAGQILMTIDPKDVNQSVEAANAQLTSAVANQKLAADNAARFNKLYAGGAVSEAMRDQYNTQLEAANAALRQAQANANASGNQLSYTQLTSDADGVVAAITGAAGTPMVTIVRSGEREIQINVPENVKLSIGQQADISFWALPDVTAKGTVREISPIADSITRTYKVRVAVPQLPAEAKLGMTAKVSFKDAAAAADELVIPATALYQVNGKTQVWLVRNNRAVLQDVKVAGYVGTNVRLAGGLNKGDILITAGLSKLVDNQQVRLTKGGDI